MFTRMTKYGNAFSCQTNIKQRESSNYCFSELTTSILWYPITIKTSIYVTFSFFFFFHSKFYDSQRNFPNFRAVSLISKIIIHHVLSLVSSFKLKWPRRKLLLGPWFFQNSKQLRFLRVNGTSVTITTLIKRTYIRKKKKKKKKRKPSIACTNAKT